jgi:hypothetical protein
MAFPRVLLNIPLRKISNNNHQEDTLISCDFFSTTDSEKYGMYAAKEQYCLHVKYTFIKENYIYPIIFAVNFIKIH